MNFFANIWATNRTLVFLVAILIVITPFLLFYLKKAKAEHPKGLIAAALSNMGERFGYYIMNGVLLLFLVSKFGLDDGVAGLIYSVFYFGIYILALVGGRIADRTQNYNKTIQIGLFIMAAGYVALAIPLFSKDPSSQLIADGTPKWIAIVVYTCIALLAIAFGNGLFKGNLSALVGKIYDDYEAAEAKKGEEALKLAKSKRDSGFQIFYVFINMGGVVAAFIAPILREFWLKANGFIYNAKMPALCHQYLADGQVTDNLTETIASSLLPGTAVPENLLQFSSDYIEIYNTGIHFSFIASAIAMVISLIVFLTNKKKFPQPSKKVHAQSIEYTEEEKVAMAKEIKQRMAALFAVLGIAIFFWLSFHQNGQSLSVFARDFVETKALPAEVWQAMNPLFVIILTPIVMLVFGALARKGKPVSTPRKIALGMAIAGAGYLFLMIYSIINNYPSGTEFRAMDASAMAAAGISKAAPWVMVLTYFFLTVAELFISPLGLSFVSKVAPKNLLGMCQGLWLAATAIGNLFIFLGPIMYNAWPIWKCWGVFLIVCLVSMSIMFGMVKWLEKVTKA